MSVQRSNRGPRTTAVHAGEAPDPITGASAPNLVMSSTYVMEKPAGFSAHELDEESGFIYSRWGNPTVAQLEQKLAAMEGGEACLAFASGMAATAAVLLSALSTGDHVVVSDTNYAGTAELTRQTLPRFGIEVTTVDTSDPANIANAMRPNTKLVWVETPANPILRITNLREAARIAHSGGAKLAVDSTFATPIATNPLALGADYVVHSLTKYICGHGDAVGGAVIGSKQAIAAIHLESTIHHGGVISPFNAWMIIRGAATLPIRMAAHQASAMKVAQFLEDDPRVPSVLYPGLASHPQHDVAAAQMDNFSGIIAFRVADGPATARRMTEKLAIIHYAVSLGHHRSLICWIGTDALMESSFQLSGKQLASYRAMAGDGVFRLSIGLEDPEDLIADLDQVL